MHGTRILTVALAAAVTVTLAAQQPTSSTSSPSAQAPPATRRPTRSSISTRTTSRSKSTRCSENIQKMNDTVFSFGELGFQEFETSKYLTGILEKNGFTIERGVAGIPTAWMATLGHRASR